MIWTISSPAIAAFAPALGATSASRFEELSRLGQRPRALVIACSDSRTDPQMVFNAAPGELFVIRNVANLVPPYGPDDQPHGVSSAIEFAVRALQVREIVVMGHAMCGGIQALLNGAPAEVSDFVGQWVRIAEPARRRAMAAPAERRQDVCEHESVRLSLENLMTFPWIESAVDAGEAEAARLLLRYPFRCARTARRGRRFSPDSRLRQLCIMVGLFRATL